MTAETTSKCPVDWRPDDEEMLHDVYGKLDEQRETCPMPLATSRAGVDYYSALAWDDVVKVVTDKRSFSSAANVLRSDLRRIPVELDPPEHTAMRRMLQPYFSPRRMEILEPRIAGFAAEMIGDLVADIGDGATGEIEYITPFAAPYPTRVLCAALNFPDEDWGNLKTWSLGVSSQGFGDGSGPNYDECNENLKEYARSIIADRRANPLPVEDDMTSGMLAAEFDGQPLSDDQLVGVLRLMVSAGHLTTTIALGIITEYLARNGEQQQWLRENPDAVVGAIEEILRHTSPVVANANPRTVIAPITLGGRDLEPGDRVLPVWGAANRDPKKFENADQISLPGETPRTLVYGQGIHMCLGAAIARFELAEATRELLAATSSFELAEEVQYGDFWRQRGPTTLKLRVTR